MGDKTAIEWCDATFNPWWGCAAISPACDHCYAEAWAKRTGTAKWGVDEPRRTFGDKHWNEPLKWARTMPPKLGRRPRVFCASMADVFDKNAPEGARERLWALIDATPELDWLLLTKRIGNVPRMRPGGWLLLPNVWLGITICNQEEADRDIPKLLDVPAHRRFLSCEPLLGPVDLRMGIARIHWVISGGESGPKARPSHPDWHRSLRDQCADDGVPFLFKQWGEWAPVSIARRFDNWSKDDVLVKMDGTTHTVTLHDHERYDASDVPMLKVGKKAAGRIFDGRTHNGFPA
jgi:protein gp37